MAYRSWDEEPREEVEECIESCGKYGCYMVVWCNGHSHHSIVCEVEEGEEVDKVKPEEFWSCPLKADHGVHNKSIVRCLNKNEWDLYQHLHYSHDSISIMGSFVSKWHDHI